MPPYVALNFIVRSPNDYGQVGMSTLNSGPSKFLQASSPSRRSSSDRASGRVNLMRWRDGGDPVGGQSRVQFHVRQPLQKVTAGSASIEPIIAFYAKPTSTS